MIEGRQARQYVNEPLRAQLRTAGLFCLNMDALGIALMTSTLSGGGKYIAIMPCNFTDTGSITLTSAAWTQCKRITISKEAPTTVFAFLIKDGSPSIDASMTTIGLTKITQTNSKMYASGIVEYSLSWSGDTSIDLYLRSNTGQQTTIDRLNCSAWLYCIF